jgi:UDP-2-acetamido-3-amino-2,3-dideoxy-glucuronate N-acetyltransferase
MKAFVHPSAFVEEGVKVGDNSKVWHLCHLREGCVIEESVNLGKDVFVDAGVTIRKGTRVQNGVSIYNGVHVGMYCFIGPHVIFTNDQFPRAGSKGWKIVPTELYVGCSIGAGAVIRCGITLGAFSMVGAGAIVSKSVPDFTLVTGLPAKEVRKICACGQTKLPLKASPKELVRACCKRNLEAEMYEMALEVQQNLTQVRKSA